MSQKCFINCQRVKVILTVLVKVWCMPKKSKSVIPDTDQTTSGILLLFLVKLQ